MKIVFKYLKQHYTLTILLSFLVCNGLYAQVPDASQAACGYCGYKVGHEPGCYQEPCPSCGWTRYKHSSSCTIGKQGTKPNNQSTVNPQKEMEAFIMGALIQALFSAPQKDNKASAAEIERQKQLDIQRQQALARQMALLKRYNDSIAQAKHDKMMKDYKPLDGSGELKYKGLDDKKWQPVKFNCKITSLKGEAIIAKMDGRKIHLRNSVDADLSPGDWIVVGKNSKLKLHYDFQNGGKDISIGENTLANIVTDENGDHLVNIQNGKYYETSTIKGKVMDVIDDANISAEEIQNVTLNLLREKYKYKFTVRTPTAICGIRGTSYETTYDSISGTRIKVFEGNVALINPITKKFILLKEGQKGELNKSGELIGPSSFSETKENKWWEE